MSFVHRLVVGHFDIDAFVRYRPVPLRSVDVPRARAMLEEIGKRTGEWEYDVDGEPLSIRDGYCDCPWLSARHNHVSERFARALAEIEDCFLIENPGSYTPPSGYRPREGGGLAPLPRAEADAIARRGDDPGVLCQAVLRAAVSEGDWAEGFCAELAGHGDFHVRGNALFALGRLARRGTPLDRETIQPIIEGALADPVPYVSGQARLAAEAVELQLMWVIRAFDNGNPEIEVSTYSNGWIRCPNCGWRFATYSARAFREGRCMGCRQRLRVR